MPELREDHASYLAHWLDVLRAGNRAIFTAASQAQRATDYLHALHKTLGIATEPGIRLLAAHCHFGRGKLHAGTG